jgi:hypothetical protein
MLLEEGRRTVASAIALALIKWDKDLAWADADTPTTTTTVAGGKKGGGGEGEDGGGGGLRRMMRLSSLIDEVREHWRRSEGDEGDDDNGRPSLFRQAPSYGVGGEEAADGGMPKFVRRHADSTLHSLTNVEDDINPLMAILIFSLSIFKM